MGLSDSALTENMKTLFKLTSAMLIVNYRNCGD